MKAIIIYYSRSGNTEKIALQAQKDMKCEIIKIVPEEAYGNYISSCLRVTKEKKAAAAPAFTNPIPDLTDYNMILLGYPIWAQDLPRFVSDFISQCDLTNKIVVPFAAYGMSGINCTMNHLQKLCVNAEIRYPFDSGVFKKGNYDIWIKQVLKECSET
ncbi:flavodoxin [uncultured Roseburia sp.]|uniref:Flavodoxin n=1 Tax=Brotonthovivens ammoniilytica TaxID=2981725 RepID=A0ABT2TI90_9FIRM|nr:flavodoxin [Brotonthovivens ammoniilytica]MCU6761576.1 flavodoxin [Brotonthovivens ammoniilytica]SCI32477.1 flavodoxin [uncultured Roseburia sp.]